MVKIAVDIDDDEIIYEKSANGKPNPRYKWVNDDGTVSHLSLTELSKFSEISAETLKSRVYNYYKGKTLFKNFKEAVLTKKIREAPPRPDELLKKYSPTHEDIEKFNSSLDRKQYIDNMKLFHDAFVASK